MFFSNGAPGFRGAIEIDNSMDSRLTEQELYGGSGIIGKLQLSPLFSVTTLFGRSGKRTGAGHFS
jgi:hypothetical protein